MPYCEQCGTEVRVDDSFCEQCGADVSHLGHETPTQETDSAEHGSSGSSIGKLAAIGVGVVIMAFISLACVGLLIAGGGDGGAGTPAPTPTAVSTTHEVGESFVVGSGNHSVEYEITEANVTTQETAAFVDVRFNATNVGTETARLSSSLYLVVDAEDRQYEPEVFEVVGGGAVGYEIAPGFTAKGVMTFKLPTDHENPRLRIEPAGLFSTADEHTVVLRGQ